MIINISWTIKERNLVVLYNVSANSSVLMVMNVENKPMVILVMEKNHATITNSRPF